MTDPNTTKSFPLAVLGAVATGLAAAVAGNMGGPWIAAAVGVPMLVLIGRKVLP